MQEFYIQKAVKNCQAYRFSIYAVIFQRKAANNPSRKFIEKERSLSLKYIDRFTDRAKNALCLAYISLRTGA